jgi:hypothetical protein
VSEVLVRGFAYPGHGRSLGVGWYALDEAGNLVLADDAGNPGSSVVNAALQAYTSARAQIRMGGASSFSDQLGKQMADQPISQVWVLDYNDIPCRFDPEHDRLIDNIVQDSDHERAKAPQMQAIFAALGHAGWRRAEDDPARLALSGGIAICPSRYEELACISYAHDDTALVVADQWIAGTNPLRADLLIDEVRRHMQRSSGCRFDRVLYADDDLRVWERLDERPGSWRLTLRTEPFIDAAVIRMLHDGWRSPRWPR